MNHICTWICVDAVGEESIYPQTGEKSSGLKHQNIYWRCILLFFATSKRFNKTQKHILFSNTRQFPVLDGKDVRVALEALDVEIIYTDFNYKTPKGYFNLFQNQFYEFSILEYITKNNTNQQDQYLILDSDCIFTKNIDELFDVAAPAGFISFEDDCSTDLVIHGLSRKDMKTLYEELLGREVNEIPGYHYGEFFLANVKNINTIFNDFKILWPELLARFEAGLPKFNEEAQTLSYIYYKNNFIASKRKDLLKRFWTNPVFYRNVENTDTDVAIWHLPSEKTYGLANLYKWLILKHPNFGLDVSAQQFTSNVRKILGVPKLTLGRFTKYYVVSYYRAANKRIKKMITA
ncbi:hypothetical protein [Pedobacter endophyticus]|uniref:Uncharacterized protein n=1 Tax=Pedobacter endophyticus TaxID=2789740 RepID=A0A7S9L2L2_9SPHI|nr:hypothetical protein [Pedobacter endophyticus]QPH41293.1 hypothetical protein IZT61_08575 [Pedobacter endophyticus]